MASSLGAGLRIVGCCIAALVALPDPSLVAQDSGDRLPADEWRVGDEPAFVIGSLGSGPESSLYQVSGAVRLSDGRVVVANGGNSQLVEFSPEGRYLSSIGRDGQGPGEFYWLTSLQRGPNDSLFAFDGQMQRLTVFSGDGRLERTARFEVEADVRGRDALVSAKRLADGVWVGRARDTNVHGAPGEIMRDTISVGLLDGALDALQPLAHLPARMTATIVRGGRRSWTAPAFSPRPVLALWGRCVFMSSAEDRSIFVFSSEGEPVTTFQGPGSPRSVTQEHVESWLDFKLTVNNVPEEERQETRRRLATYPHPATLPYYSHMVADQWGHIWLQEYSPPDGLGRRWYVLSQSGRLLGEVTMPKRMRAFEITEDGVLARTLGELDEEMVELFPLSRRPSAPAPPLAECEPSTGVGR